MPWTFAAPPLEPPEADEEPPPLDAPAVLPLAPLVAAVPPLAAAPPPPPPPPRLPPPPPLTPLAPALVPEPVAEERDDPPAAEPLFFSSRVSAFSSASRIAASEGLRVEDLPPVWDVGFGSFSGVVVVGAGVGVVGVVVVVVVVVQLGTGVVVVVVGADGSGWAHAAGVVALGVDCVPEGGCALESVGAGGLVLVLARLTNSARGAAAVPGTLVASEPDRENAADVALPAPDELLAAPVDPSTVSIEVIRCEPGRNTICPSATVPVSVSPTADCHSSTAVVVAVCQVSFKAS